MGAHVQSWFRIYWGGVQVMAAGNQQAEAAARYFAGKSSRST
jgi:hypothetical protein